METYYVTEYCDADWNGYDHGEHEVPLLAIIDAERADPNANLAELRSLAPMILSGSFEAHDAERMAELIEALDEWLTKGGFLPDAWKVNR
jgi:hypothetical protein